MIAERCWKIKKKRNECFVNVVVVVDRKELSGEMWSRTRRLICWNLEMSGGERVQVRVWNIRTSATSSCETSWHGTFMENGRGVSIIRCNATQLIKIRRDGPSVITTLDRLSSEVVLELKSEFRKERRPMSRHQHTSGRLTCQKWFHVFKMSFSSSSPRSTHPVRQNKNFNSRILGRRIGGRKKILKTRSKASFSRSFSIFDCDYQPSFGGERRGTINKRAFFTLFAQPPEAANFQSDF